MVEARVGEDACEPGELGSVYGCVTGRRVECEEGGSGGAADLREEVIDCFGSGQFAIRVEEDSTLLGVNMISKTG